MKSRYRQAFVLLITVITVTLTGCSDAKGYKTPDQLAVERQTEIMDCFINKDAETIKSFFSEYVIETYPDIDTQIDKAFNFLDGEIISYDEPFSSASGSKDRKAYGADTRNIITDKGTEYKISFKGWLTNSKETNKVGVICIKVIDMTDEYDYSKNEKENGILYIGEPD